MRAGASRRDPRGTKASATAARPRTSAIPPSIRVPWLPAALAALLAAAVAAALALSLPGGSGAPAPPIAFALPVAPAGIAAEGGRVWVALPGAGAVWVLDGASGRRLGPPLRTGGAPFRLALSSGGAWAADSARGAVVPIRRVPEPRVFRAIGAGADVADVALAAGAVWTASSAEGVVRVLERGRSRPRAVPVGPNPVDLAASPAWVVAVVAGTGELVRFDARTRGAAGPPVRLGGVPVAAAVSGDTAWVADAGGGSVRRVDLRRGRATGPPVRVGERPVAIAAGGNDVYVLCAGDRTLVRVDARSGEVAERRPAGREPVALALDGVHVWVSDADGAVIRHAR